MNRRTFVAATAGATVLPLASFRSSSTAGLRRLDELYWDLATSPHGRTPLDDYVNAHSDREILIRQLMVGHPEEDVEAMLAVVRENERRYGTDRAAPPIP